MFRDGFNIKLTQSSPLVQNPMDPVLPNRLKKVMLLLEAKQS